jgi:hypothetical protein
VVRLLAALFRGGRRAFEATYRRAIALARGPSLRVGSSRRSERAAATGQVDQLMRRRAAAAPSAAVPTDRQGGSSTPRGSRQGLRRSLRRRRSSGRHPSRDGRFAVRGSLRKRRAGAGPSLGARVWARAAPLRDPASAARARARSGRPLRRDSPGPGPRARALGRTGPGDTYRK